MQYSFSQLNHALSTALLDYWTKPLGEAIDIPEVTYNMQEVKVPGIVIGEPTVNEVDALSINVVMPGYRVNDIDAYFEGGNIVLKAKSDKFSELVPNISTIIPVPSAYTSIYKPDDKFRVSYEAGILRITVFKQEPIENQAKRRRIKIDNQTIPTKDE